MVTCLPLVSVGVPCYNYAAYITQTLNSIASQTYKNIEIIIINDCSTDNSEEVIKNWIAENEQLCKVTFIKNEKNLGLTKVSNILLEHANGEYFQMLDADDLILPNKIELQVEKLRCNPWAAIIYSNASIIDEQGNLIVNDYLEEIGYDKDDMPEGKIFDQLIKFNFIPLPTALIRTKFAKDVGGFDNSLQVQDYYLWLRLSQDHEIQFLKEITAYYRRHELSMSRNSKTNPRSVESVLEIKYRYYKACNAENKRLIKKNIFNSVPYLYQFKTLSCRKWLRKNLMLNFGIKSLAYFLAFHCGISFSFIERLKKM